MRKKIRDPSDFEWLKQSRFHWREDRDTVITSICDVDFEYSFEYLGATLNHEVCRYAIYDSSFSALHIVHKPFRLKMLLVVQASRKGWW